MLIFRFLESLFFVLVFGYAILVILFRDGGHRRFFEAIALSLGLGYGFMSLWMLYLSLAGLEFSIISLLLPVLLLWLILFFKRKRKVSFKFNKIRPSFLKVILLILIGLSLIYSFCDTISAPFLAWDSWGQYGLKSKIFYLERGVWGRAMSDYSLNIPNKDYPLLLPLIEAYSYVFLGGIYEQYAKFASFLFFICLLALFYYLLKEIISDFFSMIFIYFLSSIPLYVYMASWGYNDIPLVFYSGLGILYLRQSIEKNNNSLFRIGCLLLCLGAWTKKEGLAILLVGFIYWLLFYKPIQKDRFRKIVFFILMVMLINMPWFIFTKYYKFTSDNVYSLNMMMKDNSLLINKLKIIVSFIAHNLLDINRWNIFWFIFVAALFYKIRHIFREKYLFAVITTYMGILILVYSICVDRDLNWLLFTTFDRVALMFIPWCFYFVAVLFAGELSYGYNNQRREGA